MSYLPNMLPGDNVLGNASGSSAIPSAVPVAPYVAFVGGELGATPGAGRDTTGDTTILASDQGTSLRSLDNAPVNYVFPAGLSQGFKIRIYQGGLGLVSFAAASGATILNGPLTSQGHYAQGYYADAENVGSDNWLITNNTASGVSSWSVVGNATIKEGDCTSFAIWRPTAANGYPAGVTIKVAGTGFNTSGFATTLVQELTNLTRTNPYVTFNGTDTLTILPQSVNPVCISFFATPTYTNIGNRDVTLTISSPSVGSIGTASVTTTILNVSKPTTPDQVLPTTTATVASDAASAQNQITLSSAAGLQVLSTVTGSANIPAQTWITAISGNVLTLSANLTGTVSASTVLTIQQPGFWFDFSDVSTITKDGSNKVSAVTDKIGGYAITQATAGNKPTYTAASLNGLGGITFASASSTNLAAVVPGQVTKTTSGSASTGSSTLTLNNVTSLTNGMAVTGTSIPIGTTISNIAGSVITLSNPITFTIGNGSTLTFSPAGATHPLITLLDSLGSQYTIFVVSKGTNTSTSTILGNNSKQFGQNSSVHGGFAFTGALDIPAATGQNNPYIWSYYFDGSAKQTRCNGQRIFIPATLTADLVKSTGAATVDDTSSLQTGLFAFFGGAPAFSSSTVNISGISNGSQTLVSAIASGTSLTIGPNASVTIPTGNTLYFFNPSSTGSQVRAPATISTAFMVGGSAPLATTLFTGVIYEIIVIPRILSSQEWRGINLKLSQKWSTSFTQTANGAAAQGSTKIVLNSAAGVGLYQTVSGTGIATGSTVVKVNSGTNTFWIDTPTTGAISNGDTLTFNYCSWKQPKQLDITQYIGTFKDDFTGPPAFYNVGGILFAPPSPGTDGYAPYFGNLRFPGTFSTAYGTAGHGSSNNVPVEIEWNLDVLNYLPWFFSYNPFSTVTPADAAAGSLCITANPTPAAIANVVGYTPPQPTQYTYTAGLLVGNSRHAQQHGYFEFRIKQDAALGSWGSWWMLAQTDVYPPEIDLTEAYGLQPGTFFQTFHAATAFTNLSAITSITTLGDILADFSREYVLLGVECTANAINFYVNREFTLGIQPSWSFQVPMYMLVAPAVSKSNGKGIPDNVTPIHFYTDYLAKWRLIPQAPTVPTSTQPETTALLAAMSVQPSAPKIAAINTLIASLKTYTTSFGQTLWQALDCFYDTAAETQQAALINWKNPAQIGVAVGSPVFSANNGFTGVPGTSYIDTGINLSAAGFQLTPALNHIGGIIKNFKTNSHQSIGGTANFFIEPKIGKQIYYVGLCNTVIPGCYSFQDGGHYLGTRNRPHLPTYQNGVLTPGVLMADGTNTLAPLDNQNIQIANGDGQVACFHSGNYLTEEDAGYLYQLLYNYYHPQGVL